MRIGVGVGGVGRGVRIGVGVGGVVGTFFDERENILLFDSMGQTANLNP